MTSIKMAVVLRAFQVKLSPGMDAAKRLGGAPGLRSLSRFSNTTNWPICDGEQGGGVVCVPESVGDVDWSQIWAGSLRLLFHRLRYFVPAVSLARRVYQEEDGEELEPAQA
jgi:hypothetical protein